VNNVHRGRYINLIEGERFLKLELTLEGYDEMLELKDSQGKYRWADWHYIVDLCEDHTGNDWDWIGPYQIGALTDCPLILGKCVQLTDDGDVSYAEEIYWHERYCVESAVECLMEQGYVLFLRAEKDEETES
jgi:hypothetical protein